MELTLECGRRKKMSNYLLSPIILMVILLFPSLVPASTDLSDAQALRVIYSSLNNPKQLPAWRSEGGDPCGESWRGIVCNGSSVVAIQLSGLQLTGTLGYILSLLLSLKILDISNNNIRDTIPYQLPPNLTSLNLAKNNLSGNLPYSVSYMVHLSYLNLSHNRLSMSVGELFSNLGSLVTLDLSFNKFTGELPDSFSCLSNLTSLYLENNHITGSVSVLANLSLHNLNLVNNRFTGRIPEEFWSIENLKVGGNSFENGQASPLPSNPHPPIVSSSNLNHTRGPSKEHQGPMHSYPHLGKDRDKKYLAAVHIVGITAGSVMVACAVLSVVFCFRRCSSEKKDGAGGSFCFLSAANDTEVGQERPERKVGGGSPMTHLRYPLEDKPTGGRGFFKESTLMGDDFPITAASYTIVFLQIATNNFSQECLIGEGSIGRVYRAECPNGKILAVKKIDNGALSLQEEDNFLEAVSCVSRLRHPNITALLGYCAEHGQRILVYEYFGNGTLQDLLHFSVDDGHTLSWNARIKIALGTAKALEYLHEVCLPSVVHRNFKSANILFDNELNPHLSDCGLAALTPNTERQVSTQIIVSFGYSAPEFAMSGVYTMKSDVYSFGVVMLELLTGRKPLDSSRAQAEQSLVRWASPQLHDIDALSKMVDPALNGMYPTKSLSRFADIIALCIQPEPEFRPPMSEVVQSLVRLMQRARTMKLRSSDESGLICKYSEHGQRMDAIKVF